ncbi:hypothetical protein CPC08DRAFT_769711 [Agrocybe pediades]|nr:hypothetical protein CPC08DRAFT_769711 [Agrocybe pediades]
MSHAASQDSPIIPGFLGPNSEWDSAPLIVQYWNSVVLAVTTSPDLVGTYTVEQLEWWKNSTGLRHEYLIATIVCPNQERVLLRFDRRGTGDQAIEEVKEVQDENERGEAEKALEEEELQQDVPQADKSPYVSRSVFGSGKVDLRSSLSTKTNSTAADTVTHVHRASDPAGNPSKRLAVYTDFLPKFPLRHLAIIVRTVNQYAPEYKLFSEQCFWFQGG